MAFSSAIDKVPQKFDVICIGAGFAGLYSLHKLRQQGYSVRVFEAGDGIGGTWFWNRYPGARCDVESMQYSYSFSSEIQQEWNWSELYAPQPEILSYINFVADRLDLRRDIALNTRIAAATYLESRRLWEVATEAGETFQAAFLVMASGCLSVPLKPQFPGLADFEGEVYRTSAWPKTPVSLAGRRVGIVGTGSSGIQVTPRIAEQAGHLTVFQRTPNYSIPAYNRQLDDGYRNEWKRDYDSRRQAARLTRNNTLNNANDFPGKPLTPHERQLELERRWAKGGIAFMYAYTDMTTDVEVNRHASDFVRKQIATIVNDPATANTLTPHEYGIGGKRICVDTDYYQTFNRDNVNLVDIRKEPIVRIVASGIVTAAATYPLDVIVLAVGFDAMTGALMRIDITGRDGRKLRDQWVDGPKTYLGMAVSGFPNMFLITGPGSPSVFTNMVTSIEQHVEWISDCLNFMSERGKSVIEANESAQEKWSAHVNELGAKSIFSSTNSWYVGANVPGKARVVMPYLGGAAVYAARCQVETESNYEGFHVQ